MTRDNDGESAPERFDQSSHWISAQLEAGVFGIEDEYLTGVLKFGLVPDLLAAIYVATQWNEIQFSFLVASALFLFWANSAPYLIWYYDKRVMPRFFTKMSEIIVDRDRLGELATKYDERFADYRPLLTLLWGGGFLLGGWLGKALFMEQGMVGDGQIFLWTTLAYGAFVGGVFGESGFSATVTTIAAVREISELEFDIRPLHPDGLGGMSTIGYYAIRTTVLWSTASLLIPLAFQMIAFSSANYAMYLVTIAYIGTILFSFLYPTLKINRRGEELREEILRQIRAEYLALQEQISDTDGDAVASVSDRLELQRLRRQYDDYNTVRLYPMQIQIMVRLAGSLLLPLFFMFLEMYLPEILG